MAGKRKSRRIGIRQRLGRLTYRGACRILGDEEHGPKLLRQGNKFDLDLNEDISIIGDTFRAAVRDLSLPSQKAIVTIVEMTTKPKGIHCECDQCDLPCSHLAAALTTILDEKTTLGIAAPPDESEALEHLTSEELQQRALAEREERANTEKMMIRSVDPSQPWTDYNVLSRQSGKTYRVSLRGFDAGQSYCSCPDFRLNRLGTCKHVINVMQKVKRKFTNAQLAKPYQRKNLSLRVDYQGETGLRFNLPTKLDRSLEKAIGKFTGVTLTDVKAVIRCLKKLEKSDIVCHVYPDAEEFINQRLLQQKLTDAALEIRQDPESHPLRKNLLKTELLPYQMDGIAFAVGTGRAILADDMGLGKTIQGIGVGELLGQLAGISRVLVVCPASLKSQWRNEIQRFSDRDCQIVLGSADERAEQYLQGKFFTICNYEQILRDHSVVERVNWDLIILDEGQRIKNWESKTSRLLKSLKSTFALVLSGTPLENRLEELFTVVGFVDDQRLGPAYQFFHRHRIVDDDGRLAGYRNLEALREKLKPMLLRRTRAMVLQELPERTTNIVRIEPTAEQVNMSNEYLRIVAQITAKNFLTEMDLLRLRQCLLMARLAANSTFLVDKEEPSFSSKLERMAELFDQLAQESDRKIVLFSEWTKMLNLIEPLLEKAGLEFVRLDGSVPQKKRQTLVHEFQNNPNCRVIIMTNAGSTGLNLQAANTVINVDLPWNPAILEQRIGRAHRMGQKRPVDVYLLVTEDTIEEKLLATLSAKHDLAQASLDFESDVDSVELRAGIDDLKKRLERLLGPAPAAPIDESMRREVEEETIQLQQRREKVAAASGELLGAALNLVGELLDNGSQPDSKSVDLMTESLNRCVERDEQGRPQLRFTLPDDQSLNGLATTLAKLLVGEDKS